MGANDHTVGELRDMFWPLLGERPAGISCDDYDRMVKAKLREIIDAARYTHEVLQEAWPGLEGPLHECLQRLKDAVGMLPSDWETKPPCGAAHP